MGAAVCCVIMSVMSDSLLLLLGLIELSCHPPNPVGPKTP